MFISHNPAQVLKLAGKRYLTGPVIFYRTDGHSTIVSLTVEDVGVLRCQSQLLQFIHQSVNALLVFSHIVIVHFQKICALGFSVK